MAELSDSELLQAYQEGDQRAFEALLHRYERPLFAFLIRLTGNRDDAEDIYQDTWTRVVRNVESYNEQGKFARWLFAIARHLCMDRARWQKRWKIQFMNQSTREEKTRNEIMDPEPLPDILHEREAMNGMILQVLERISPEQKEIFLLRQHSDITFREIAEMVDRPLNTVLGQMRLAILSIRKFLQEQMK